MELADIVTEQWLIEEFGATKQQIYRMRKRGLPYMVVGRSVRLYDAHDVAEYLERQKVSGMPREND